jgi:hypothetical protein
MDVIVPWYAVIIAGIVLVLSVVLNFFSVAMLWNSLKLKEKIGGK